VIFFYLFSSVLLMSLNFPINCDLRFVFKATFAPLVRIVS
jgi:hypothetical protein